MTATNKDSLTAQAVQGRGLWIGMEVPVTVWRREYPAHPLLPWLPTSAHITLLHLGKDKETAAARVEAALLAARDATHTSMPWWPHWCSVTGYGWLRRSSTSRSPRSISRPPHTLVALINSAQLSNGIRPSVYNRVVAHTRGQWKLDDYFGFIPHVTLQPDHEAELVGVGAMARALQDASPLRWQANALQVHCGDVTVELGAESPW